jgi:hypothetical protein
VALVLVVFVAASRLNQLAALTVDRIAAYPNGLVLTLWSRTKATGP